MCATPLSFFQAGKSGVDRDEGGGHPHQPHEQLHGGAPAARRQQLVQLGHVGGRSRRSAVVDDEGRLVHGEPVDRRSVARRLHREHSAGGDAAHVRPSAGLADQRLDVLDLTLHGVGRRVAALPATAAVVGDHREAIGELRRQLAGRPGLPPAQRAVDDDQRRPRAGALEGDRRSVGGADGAHGPPDEAAGL